ncbi:MAG TPA: hypothetical protein VK623_13010 [Flavobacterium sp.]|nr:hypothetical protein [Flavobacterium sp.]
MKRLLGLLVCMLILNGCDDGDLTVDSFDFSNETAQRCDNKIYKLTDTEALIVEIPYDQAFINDPTPEGEPITFTISSSANRVVYRSYNGSVAGANICGTIPPATPNVTQEWVATSGIIEITTIAVKTANTDTGFEGGENINKYRHTITFRNINFLKPDGTNQLYETFAFGTYDTNATELPFNFDDDLDKCDTTNTVFNFVGNEALMLNIDPNLLPNEQTTLEGLISTTTNKLTYSLFTNGALSADYFCTSPVPATPTITETWAANDGVADISGIVKVITTSGGGTGVYEHEIHLINVTLKKGNSEFLLAEDYLFGTLITP